MMNLGCAGIASSAPLQAGTATKEPIAPVSTITTALPKTQVPVQVVEPFITASRLRFDSWSPDSQWMAYWFGDNDTLAYLAFANIRSGRICQHKEITAEDIYGGGVVWSEDNSVIAIQPNGITFRGAPCGVFSESGKFALPDEETIFSPNGRYRAQTTRHWDDQLIQNITTISDVSTEQIIATVSWDGSPHFQSDHGWLNNELFLIGVTVDQGVLYVSLPDGEVGNVMTELMKLDYRDLAIVAQVRYKADTENNRFHLLVERWKASSDLPILLYHSETHTVEKLPFSRAWTYNGSSFSKDGKWIFASPPLTPDGSIQLWLYSVDSPESTPIKIAEGTGLGGLSNESQKLAFFDNNLLRIFSFPDGRMLSQWGATDYSIDRLWWSPDGKWLVVQGFPSSGELEAIFVIEP
jgi:hypothetical protein